MELNKEHLLAPKSLNVRWKIRTPSFRARPGQAAPRILALLMPPMTWAPTRAAADGRTHPTRFLRDHYAQALKAGQDRAQAILRFPRWTSSLRSTSISLWWRCLLLISTGYDGTSRSALASTQQSDDDSKHRTMGFVGSVLDFANGAHGLVVELPVVNSGLWLNTFEGMTRLANFACEASNALPIASEASRNHAAWPSGALQTSPMSQEPLDPRLFSRSSVATSELLASRKRQDLSTILVP